MTGHHGDTTTREGATFSPGAAGTHTDAGLPERGLYAYAIVRAGRLDLAEVTGVGGRRPRLVTYRDLALVVADIPLAELTALAEEDLSETGPLADLASKHDTVIRALLAQSPVLPLRLGTVVTDKAGAVRLLEQHYDAARGRLDACAGHREWGVRLHTGGTGDTAGVQDTGPDIPSPTRSGDADASAPTSGTAYLLRRRAELTAAEARRTHLITAADTVHAALAGIARDSVRQTTRSRADTVLDAAYLVAEPAEPAFFVRLDQLATELRRDGLTLEVTGPWPPYSFARLDAEEVPE